MDHLTIKIHWKGPYFLEEIEELEARNGLYLFAGKQKYQREDDIQYFGITKDKFKNRFKNHHKIDQITRDLQVWLGEITYPSDFAREHLETAESIMVYFWGASLNERKKYTPPRAITV